MSERPGTARKVAIWVIGILLVGCVLAALLILALPKPDQSEQLRQQLQAMDANFPLYYTKELPDTVKLTSSSINKHEEAIIYTLIQDTNQISVTQQPRPRLMEEVNKVKDIPSPLGKAYVAKLDGHTVGFLVTATTLVIISSVQNLDDSTLEALLKNVVVL